MGPETIRQWLPIGISAVSLILASFALGWSIYRDVVLKASVAVRFAVVSIMAAAGDAIRREGRFLNITVVNHGPGPVTIQTIAGRISPWWRTVLRRPQHFVILNDHTNPMNPRLPARLDVGDTLNLFLPYDARCFLGTEATHIGVTDSYGRLHLAPPRHVNDARNSFMQDFGTPAGA
jgi:hypothetical protein